MPTVYIINKSPHDFSSAEKFGTLEFLSKGSINKYATNKILRLFEEGLRNSKKEDYILLTSLTVMNVLACSIFVLKHKTLNLLLLKDGEYVERKHDLDSLDSIIV